MSAELVADALAECESVIDGGMKTFIEVGKALARVREECLYREQFETFEEYCQQRWSLNSSRARQIIAASTMTVEISTVTDRLPQNEGQAKALSGLAPEIAAQVMDHAHEATDGKLTATAIRDAREEIASRTAKPKLSDVITDEQIEALKPENQSQSPDEIHARMEDRADSADDEARQKLYDYLDGDQEIKDARYVADFMTALIKARQVFQFDAERLANLIDADVLDSIHYLADSAQRYEDKVKRARSGLRVINGGVQ